MYSVYYAYEIVHATHVCDVTSFTLLLYICTVTTKCVISELSSLGKKLSGAVYIIKRFKLRKCSHTSSAVSATECILSLIGESRINTCVCNFSC